jgi:hypothetical protein
MLSDISGTGQIVVQDCLSNGPSVGGTLYFALFAPARGGCDAASVIRVVDQGGFRRAPLVVTGPIVAKLWRRSRRHAIALRRRTDRLTA